MVEVLTITGMGHRGDGVADAPAGPIYTPYVLPGEVVEVDTVAGHPDRRHLLRVVTASAERIAPICQHFTVCGGCAVQHWDYAQYRAWKLSLVARVLDIAGVTAEIDDLIDAHGDGRRRAVFHARRGAGDVLEVGFASYRAHRIVSIDECPVLAPGLNGAIPAAWAIAEALATLDKPLDIHVTATDAGLDIDVRGSGPLKPQHVEVLARAAGKHGLARLTRHGEMVVQRAVPTLRMGKATVPLPPGAFLQATAEGEAALAHQVQAHAASAKSIADLFAGVGPFALRLAERAKVLAADSDEPAIAALIQASKAPGLKPITAMVRDLFRRPYTAPELNAYECVVFDPPRQGAEAQARELAKAKVPLIIAVSCNPATFARDAKLLIDAGYSLKRLTPIDQFRYTPHVELVARFEH